MYFKEFRKRIKLTQKEIADKLDIAQAAVARYEMNNNVNPTSNIIFKYVNEFNANPNFLFLGIEPILLNKQLEINKKYLLEEKREQLKQLENEIKQLVKKVEK